MARSCISLNPFFAEIEKRKFENCLKCIRWRESRNL